jgi:hypothetical protein
MLNYNEIFISSIPFYFFLTKRQTTSIQNINESIIFLPLQASCATGTGGLAQAGQWLARKFVQICKFIACPSVSGSPAYAKPLGR